MRTPIPRRVDTAEERGVLIVASATHKQKGLFFFLLQSEYGDLYKVSVNTYTNPNTNTNTTNTNPAEYGDLYKVSVNTYTNSNPNPNR